MRTLMFFNRLFRIFFGHNLCTRIYKYIYIFDLGHLNCSVISTKTYLISNKHTWEFHDPQKQCKLTVKGKLPTHGKVPPKF